MNFVYAIVCHKYTNSLIFTVNDLLKSRNSIVILHIDAKASDDEVNKIEKVLGVNQNLIFIPRNDAIDVKWGSFSQIEVMLLLLKKAAEYEFLYFSLISGDDIPVENNVDREEFLLNSYKLKTEYIGLDRDFKSKARVELKYPDFFYKKSMNWYSSILKKASFIYLYFFRKQDLSSFPCIYKGCNWFTITDVAVKYIFDYLHLNPLYIESFKKSFCADEIFFQTIIFNEITLRKNIYGIHERIDDGIMSMRYIDWKTGPEYPRILDESDFIKIKQSKLLFARKISNRIPLNILEKEFRN